MIENRKPTWAPISQPMIDATKKVGCRRSVCKQREKMWAVCVSLWLLASSAAFAEDSFGFRCNYNLINDLDGMDLVEDDFQLIFLVDRLDEGVRARMIGNVGTEDVQLVSGAGGAFVSFIEITSMGNVATTTINMHDGASVHSRNMVISGELIPSQYYGKCAEELD